MSSVYIFDTNAISAMIEEDAAIVMKLRAIQLDTLVLCQPVDYEIRRGFLKNNAVSRLNSYETRIKPLFSWSRLIDTDWQQAAQFWAYTKAKGRQLSDIDLLIAAVAVRLNAILVTNDNDFEALPAVIRENWR